MATDDAALEHLLVAEDALAAAALQYAAAHGRAVHSCLCHRDEALETALVFRDALLNAAIAVEYAEQHRFEVTENERLQLVEEKPN